jgi:hypothetical protein
VRHFISTYVNLLALFALVIGAMSVIAQAGYCSQRAINVVMCQMSILAASAAIVPASSLPLSVPTWAHVVAAGLMVIIAFYTSFRLVAGRLQISFLNGLVYGAAYGVFVDGIWSIVSAAYHNTWNFAGSETYRWDAFYLLVTLVFIWLSRREKSFSYPKLALTFGAYGVYLLLWIAIGFPITLGVGGVVMHNDLETNFITTAMWVVFALGYVLSWRPIER